MISMPAITARVGIAVPGIAHQMPVHGLPHVSACPGGYQHVCSKQDMAGFGSYSLTLLTRTLSHSPLSPTPPLPPCLCPSLPPPPPPQAHKAAANRRRAAAGPQALLAADGGHSEGISVGASLLVASVAGCVNVLLTNPIWVRKGGGGGGGGGEGGHGGGKARHG
jgi:hypothetical protein